MGLPVHVNHLIHETSPYLLQHAHNPVNWYPWNEAALLKAKQENKPILVSIGYAACHWCHVMERESFEDEATAALMNEHFVNIKVDREERPDIDNIYMTAVQTMTGSGGWPLNVFLTPEGKPFYGGTYFPAKPAFNLPSWQQVIREVAHVFEHKREEIELQAESLTERLKQSAFLSVRSAGADEPLTGEQFVKIFEQIMSSADRQEGGFGRAPKFPQTLTIRFLLRHHWYSGNEDALRQALLSLDKMISGGLYDQVGGGFARYATDRNWLVPHFEKMLYDNALLIIVLSEAYQITKQPLYAETVQYTMDFIERELMDAEGGFYSSLDADSEGEEGKYYVWGKEEIEAILQEEAPLFCKFYGVTDEGNWEGHNILNVSQPPEKFAGQYGLEVETLKKTLKNCRGRLLEIREKRIRPSLDDKILLNWNALMNEACSSAFAAFGDERYKKLAQKNMAFLLSRFEDKKNEAWFHTYKAGQGRHPAFLDDYAFLIRALIGLQEITGDPHYLAEASRVTQQVINDFGDAETGLFFYSHRDQTDVLLRTKEIYDGATPSGNAIMAWNLYYLSIVFDEPRWRERAVNMALPLGGLTGKYPTSFGMWISVLYDIFSDFYEIAVVGERYRDMVPGILSRYVPNKIIQSAAGDQPRFPLLANRYVKDKTFIYLCRHYSCLMPVEKVAELMQLIDRERKR